MRVTKAIVLVGLFALAAVPGALGQDEEAFDFRLSTPEPGAFAPVNTSFVRELTLSVNCVTPAPPPEPPSFNLTATTGDPDVAASVEPAEFSFPIDAIACANGQVQEQVITATIQIGMSLQAARPVFIQVHVTSNDGRQVTSEWGEEPAPVLGASVELREDRFKSGPNSRLQLPVLVRNAGNAAIQVQFSPTENMSEHLNVALPGPVVVDLEAGHVWVPVDVQTPFENGYMERVDEFSIRADAHWVEDPEMRLDLGTHNATIETVGSYVPGPSSLLAAGIVVLVASVARRHRR